MSTDNILNNKTIIMTKKEMEQLADIITKKLIESELFSNSIC